jgi:hypothetical protein
MITIEDGVRAWARGIYATEAGAELLIRQHRAIHEGAPWLTELEPFDPAVPRMVAIDIDTLLDGTCGYSGGESRLIGSPPRYWAAHCRPVRRRTRARPGTRCIGIGRDRARQRQPRTFRGQLQRRR